MAVNTITKALKKLFKTITGQDPVSNNPTKLINELADNWSGGGGSSDFTTAEVTVSLKKGVLALPVIVTNGTRGAVVTQLIQSSIYDPPTVKYTVPLYKGVAGAVFATPPTDGVVNLTGDITDMDGDLLITGDGTITVTINPVT